MIQVADDKKSVDQIFEEIVEKHAEALDSLTEPQRDALNDILDILMVEQMKLPGWVLQGLSPHQHETVRRDGVDHPVVPFQCIEEVIEEWQLSLALQVLTSPYS